MNQEVKEMTELVRDFLDPADFYQSLKKIGIDFYCGVPDSLLKGKFHIFLLVFILLSIIFYKQIFVHTLLRM
jgi:hypothetical protein